MERLVIRILTFGASHFTLPKIANICEVPESCVVSWVRI